ncbi:hypothetical protein HYD_4790 [Candidatus Hydrogenosomobacter endosymbioticus]|uniref:Undecaprenyldiphospho-muramoylpentapeptide beta-N-acetylglucosaminyltransferase n=2 Tax=Candidatus Hydrogenosomobacter endosymbioticus TaxID=2558174 RepID=A0ABN6L778_9PROT|nr:hypothetical protein HYD_4790 [Candidatus Hydrogenosomobacter endosymbioticus]
MFPAQAMAEFIKCRGHRVTLMTDDRGVRFVEDNVYDDVLNVGDISSFLGVIRLLKESLKMAVSNRPDVVWGFGGKISAVPIVAARIFGIKFGAHQSDFIIGRANRAIARICGSLAVGYRESVEHYKECKFRIVYTGTPVRKCFWSIPRVKRLSDDVINVLVTGGSQGAKFWQNAMREALLLLSNSERRRIAVTHQCRCDQVAEVREIYEKMGLAGFFVTGFIRDMASEFAKSHVIFSRAGASTISEIMASGRAAFFVPYPFAADNHQYFNAKVIVDAGAAWMCCEKDTDGSDFGVRNEAMRLSGAGCDAVNNFHQRALLERENQNDQISYCASQMARVLTTCLYEFDEVIAMSDNAKSIACESSAELLFSFMTEYESKTNVSEK